ncbi:hypothetical protein RB614_23635 [Phytohabitans sp. ZYX-F-186]|uniref:6-bladed beta-propeller n=1 Tax=Phytohabitans maris TaxID=3071409 RepID=A0ABU0ZKD6_9ACTN|nr:hypothetical protein [Phytohabitans sp. ZYX-F-186]MDQ7907516.1 hypothetical protein [Phytohabitans sp. ZYX-F-186]
MTTASGQMAEVAGLRVRSGWERLPPGLTHRDVADVAVDRLDRVYLFVRYDSQVLVFDRDGRHLRSFGRGMFRMAHGITVDGAGCVYCVDNLDHTVHKFSPRGELLLTLGTPGIGAATGIRPGDPVSVHSVERVRHPGPPFNGCTDVAVTDGGDLFVSDGIAFDSRGSLYVAEVTYSFAVRPGWVPGDHASHQIQRFDPVDASEADR